MDQFEHFFFNEGLALQNKNIDLRKIEICRSEELFDKKCVIVTFLHSQQKLNTDKISLIFVCIFYINFVSRKLFSASS